MPKGAKKRAKLKRKQQQQGHPDEGGNNNTHHRDGNGSGSDNNSNNNNGSGRRDHNLRIPSHVDASEDSMESSEEMVTPRAAVSEPDEEDRKAAHDVPVERAVHEAEAEAEAGEEEVMVDALPPETSGQVCQGKDGEEVEVHAVVQEPEVEVKDVVVDESPPAVQEEPEVDVVVDESPAASQEEPEVAEAPVVEVPEVNREVAKVHRVHEPQHELEHKVDEAAAVVVGETPPPPAVHEPEFNGGSVVVKDSTEVLRSREVDVHTTEAQARGPAVAVAASVHRATWWNCCGLFDAFSGSER